MVSLAAVTTNHEQAAETAVGKTKGQKERGFINDKTISLSQLFTGNGYLDFQFCGYNHKNY